MDKLKEIEDRLFQFPSSFDLQTDFTKRNVKILLQKVLEDPQESYVNQTEELIAWNLISFLYWLLRDIEKAFEYNQKVIVASRSTTNVISLSNKAHFHLKQNNTSETKRLVEQLEAIKNSDTGGECIVTARAELAFSYSRFGAIYYDRSVDIFEKVVREDRSYLWKYRLGLIYRRATHPNAGSWSCRELSSNIEPAYRYLKDVAENADATKLKARAWLELGELSSSIKYNFSSKTVHQYSENENQCYENALLFDRNCPFILERCGQFYRKKRDFGKALKYLKESIECKPSSFNYHHLAITLKQMEFQRIKQPRATGGRSEYRGAYGRHRGHESHIVHGSEHQSHRPRQQIQGGSSLSHIPKSPGNKELPLVVEYLEKAIQLNETNNTAKQELGIVYIALEKYTLALKVLREITDSSTRLSSTFELAKSYEYQGVCMQNMLCLPENRNNTDLRFDANMCFYRAIEHAALIASKQLDATNSWPYFHTLKELLTKTRKPPDRNYLREVAELHELMRNHGEAIDFYQKVLELGSDEEGNGDVYFKITKNYLEVHDFDNAMLFLKLFSCTESSRSALYRPDFSRLYVKIHLEGALSKLKSGGVAKEWYSQAFSFAHKGIRKDTDAFDIVIFNEMKDDLSNEADAMAEMLETFGLKVTRNDEDVLANQTFHRGCIGIMNRSRHVVIVLHNTAISGKFKYIIDHALCCTTKDDHKSPILVVTVGDPDVPETLKTFPQIAYRPISHVHGTQHDDSDWPSALLKDLVMHV